MFRDDVGPPTEAIGNPLVGLPDERWRFTALFVALAVEKAIV